MHLPPSTSRQARFLTIVAIVISASSVALALLPNRTRPLWELALAPAVFVCLAIAARFEDRAGTTPPLRRWATVFAMLGFAFALGALFVTYCARGACVAI